MRPVSAERDRNIVCESVGGLTVLFHGDRFHDVVPYAVPGANNKLVALIAVPRYFAFDDAVVVITPVPVT